MSKLSYEDILNLYKERKNGLSKKFFYSLKNLELSKFS